MSNPVRMCPQCLHTNDKLAVYCRKCGINIDKIGFMSDMEHVTQKEEKPQRGSYEKNFFRGKKK